MSYMFKSISAIFFVIVTLLISSDGFPAEPAKEGGSIQEGAIVIRSNSLQVDDGQKTVTFIGKVDAVKEGFHIECEKMTVYYMSQSDVPGTADGRIDKIIASGKVKITLKDGGVATSEEALYDQKEEKVVLTGRPLVKQGSDVIEGDRVILFMKEKRSVVEGSDERKVRAVLSPRREKK